MICTSLHWTTISLCVLPTCSFHAPGEGTVGIHQEWECYGCKESTRDRSLPASLRWLVPGHPGYQTQWIRGSLQDKCVGRNPCVGVGGASICHWCHVELLYAYNVSSYLGGIPQKAEHPQKSVLKKPMVRVRDFRGAHLCPTSTSWESGTVTPKWLQEASWNREYPPRPRHSCLRERASYHTAGCEV